MTLLETLLAAFHLLAILTMVVFLVSEAALCRPEWMNPATVERLAKLDMIYGIAAAAVLLTGLARTYWGMKGGGYYWSNPLLHTKLTLFVIMGVISIFPTMRFLRWRKALRSTGQLPAEAEVRKTRKLVMIQAHIIPLIVVVAVFFARGWGAK